MNRPDIHALLAITMFISSRGQTTPAEIAGHLDVPVESVIDGIWSIHTAETAPGFYFLNLTLDTVDDGDEDVLLPDSSVSIEFVDSDPAIYVSAGELIVALHLLDQLMTIIDPDSEQGQSLVHIRARLAQAARDHSIGIAEPAMPEAAPTVLSSLWSALSHHREVTMAYSRSDGIRSKVTTQYVKPIAIVSEGRGYLAALHGKKDVRWYRLDRIAHVELGQVLSADDQARADRVLKRLDMPVPDGGIEVTLVARRSGLWLSETIPCVVTGDDPLRITVRSVSDDWIRTLAILLGRDLIDIEPADVKQRVVGAAREILEHYCAQVG